MGMPPLPMPPAPPMPVNSNQGGLRQPAQGLSPVPTNTPGAIGAQIANGLDQFMRSYAASKVATQAHFSSKLDELMSNIAQGNVDPASIDYKKVTKWMQASGRAYKTEAPTPQEQAYNDQLKQTTQQNSNLQGQLNQMAAPQFQGNAATGIQGPGLEQMLAGSAAPLPASPAAASQPGLGQRLLGGLKSLVGIKPDTSLQSPAAQNLQQYAQASWIGGAGNPDVVAQQGRMTNLHRNIQEVFGIPLEKMSMQEQQFLMDLKHRAVMGDPQAMDAAVRGGLTKDLEYDTVLRAVASSMPGADPAVVKQRAGQLMVRAQFDVPYAAHMWSMISSLTPRFAGRDDVSDPISAASAFVSGEPNAPRPGMTIDESAKYMDAMRPVLENYDQAALPFVRAYQGAILSGNKQAEQQALAGILRTPRKGTKEWMEHLDNWGVDKQRLEADTSLRQQQIGLNAVQAVGEAAKQEAAPFMAALNDPNSDWKTKQDALTSLRNIALKQSKVPIPIQTIGPDGKPSTFMYNMTDPKDVMGSFGWYQKHYLGAPIQPHLGPQVLPDIPNQQQMPGQFDNPAIDWGNEARQSDWLDALTSGRSNNGHFVEVHDPSDPQIVRQVWVNDPQYTSKPGRMK